MSIKRSAIVLTIGILVILFFSLDINHYLHFETLKANQVKLNDIFTQNPVITGVIFFVVYVVITGLSLPGAAVMTIAAGAIFGLTTGLVLVSFASSIGATLAFLVSRYLLHDAINSRFSKQLESVNEGVRKVGAFYLFTLRLVPLFPFFVINLVMALTPIRTFTFYWVSQIGMLAGTAVFVNAGTQLAKLESAGGILSPTMILSLSLLGIFPLLAKSIINKINQFRIYKSHPRPDNFSTNVVVIGAGAGGLVSAYIAAAVNAKVTLIEKEKMGGDCLNTGCVPSKALVRSAKFKAGIDECEKYGIANASATIDFKQVMSRVRNVITNIEPHDSIERYTELGVDVIQGEAKITSPYCVDVNGITLTTRNIIVATGGRPFVPPIEGLENIDYLTSDSIWDLEELPQRLVVLGGGPIGCELAQSFARLGSQVSLIEMQSDVMFREDKEVSALVRTSLLKDNIAILTGTEVIRVGHNSGANYAICRTSQGLEEIGFDKMLVAVGRVANTKGFGLEELGIPLNPNGTIEVNDYLQTKYPNIYAVGDVAGPYQFTHAAAHQAWYATVNSLFGSLWRFGVDYSVIPRATFVDPEVARVGLNEKEASDAGVEYELTRYDISDLDRAIADSEAEGFVKVLTVPGKDKILGVSIVGANAADMISEFVLAMRYGIGLNKILGTVHIYPTMAEANKYAAGEWKKANKPTRILALAERFHRWRRG
ncbi:FAD-dependent oxidoreductase [Pseudomaricurvus alkylphenolicus]|uniref:FAD-dependent oxidoreductase n=1 Tax=Pseudomaricurvus alkylphenolicus TaxID=1306991 RepID=UPI001423C2D4|nr:bifunctional TVP38/TMEM64 family protein/FAD-dependent oxidoreductase [Pseudomaricurvus alkylphenolicus]NIB41579.1 FAD-dependent oxidoreductase [Pseudomaricurvus alkylphenolicus]